MAHQDAVRSTASQYFHHNASKTRALGALERRYQAVRGIVSLEAALQLVSQDVDMSALDERSESSLLDALKIIAFSVRAAREAKARAEGHLSIIRLADGAAIPADVITAVEARWAESGHDPRELDKILADTRRNIVMPGFDLAASRNGGRAQQVAADSVLSMVSEESAMAKREAMGYAKDASQGQDAATAAPEAATGAAAGGGGGGGGGSGSAGAPRRKKGKGAKSG